MRDKVLYRRRRVAKTRQHGVDLENKSKIKQGTSPQADKQLLYRLTLFPNLRTKYVRKKMKNVSG